MSIHKAFLAAQKEIKHAIKDGTNPHYKNSYATLESVIDAVKDISNKHGIAIFQRHGKDEFGHFIETVLMGSEDAKINSVIYLEVDKPTMQGLGSAISYGKRYSLQSIFCLASVDDDANEASQFPVKQQTKGPGPAYGTKSDL